MTVRVGREESEGAERDCEQQQPREREKKKSKNMV